MNKIKHTAGFALPQAIDKVFPLFSPEGEKLWVPGWDYENIMGNIDLHEDDVFLTKNHDHASTNAIWLVKRFEPDAFLIQFYKVEPEDKVGIVTVQCYKKAEERTYVQVTYEYIALSPRGRKFIRSFTHAVYEQFISEWEGLLVKFFKN